MKYKLFDYIKSSFNLFSIPSMLILRIARTRPFKESIFGRFLKIIYPMLIFRSKAMYGLKIAVNPADISHLVITDEFLFEKIYDLEKVPFIPEIIMDCGGHIGMFSVLASGYYQNEIPVLVFEPNPLNIGWIRKQVILNNLGNIDIIEAAVSVYNGFSHFSIVEESFGGKLSSDSTEMQKVKVIDLVDYIDKKYRSKKTILKIDIEGEELRLLPHILPKLPNDTFLFLETHHGLKSFLKTKELIESFNFKVVVSRKTNDQYIDLYAYRIFKNRTHYDQVSSLIISDK